MFPFDMFNQEYIQLLNKSLFPLLKGAVLYSIPLAVISFIFGLIIAFTVAIIRINKGKGLWINTLSFLSRFYVSIIRGTPLLVQLFIIFYGLPNIGIKIDPFPAALLAFSLSVGAYASETIRAAILAISRNQWEASFSIGMTYFQSFRRIIFPQAMRVATPTLSNSFISLVKDTSLASVVLVTEMFREAQKIASVNYEFLLLYCEAAFIYWIICFLLTLIQEYLEKRLSKHLAK